MILSASFRIEVSAMPQWPNFPPNVFHHTSTYLAPDFGAILHVGGPLVRPFAVAIAVFTQTDVLA